jgi:hypothetical protein
MLEMVRHGHARRTAALVLGLLTGMVVVLVWQSSCAQAAEEPTAEPTEVAALIEEVAGLLLDNYLDQGVAEQCVEHMRKQLSEGAYESTVTAEELAEAITADLQAVSHDLHMRVDVVPPIEKPAKPDGEDEQESSASHPLLETLDVYHFEKRGNFGLMDVKWYSGNVGYVDLRAFLGLARVRPKVESAMTFLSDTDAIIIDLRSLVRGGYPETVGFIAGYFFDEPTLLQSIVFPRSGSVDETWSASRHAGPDFSNLPLFILTSEEVFSAAEAFAHGMQAHGRATVVGTTTMGGAHLTRGFRVEPGFDVYVPIGRAVDPVTGGNWEGVGVIPDVPTTTEEALDVALELARAAADARREVRESADRELMLDVESRLFAAVGEYGQGATESGATKLRDALRDGFSGGVLTEDIINDVGYYCLENGFSDAAVDAFSFNAEQFPNSANAHDSLGEALAAAGRLTEAAASYHRALQLDPRLSSSRAALDRLDAQE